MVQDYSQVTDENCLDFFGGYISFFQVKVYTFQRSDRFTIQEYESLHDFLSNV